MEQFTVYYGTPEGKETKIGVDCDYPSRIKRQNITDGEVLEVHTCVYEVSRREQELQREYGVRIDDVPYYVTYFRNKSLEQREKISASNRISQLGNTNASGNLGKTHSSETIAKISAAQKGVPKSDEIRAKISISLKGKRLSEEHKSKMSAAQKGVPKTKVECPHCQKVGGKSLMARYHFDNCKHKQYE